MTNKNNSFEGLIVALLRDNEKNKEQDKENIEVFEGILVADQSTITVTDSLSDPVEVGSAVVDTSLVGFCEVES